ncbi:MAG: HAD family hydrolase [Lachnospiraceae bacterium]|nr:HAD family hydrolase [Lachnospiraceae bacterium]
MTQNILFDLDGTLTDSGGGIIHSVQYALKKYGISIQDQEKLRAFIGPPLYQSFEMYCGFSPEKATEAVSFYREYYREKGMYENVPYEGIIEMLKSLKKAGRRLFVATSKPEVFARDILQYLEMSGYFDYIAGSNMDGTGSEKCEVIQYAMKAGGVQEPSRTIMVGDRRHDIIGAKQAGVASLGVLYGYGDREELVEAGASLLAENVTEAKEILLLQ